MDVKGNMLSEKSQFKKLQYDSISVTLSKRQLQRWRIDYSLPMERDGGGGEVV